MNSISLAVLRSTQHLRYFTKGPVLESIKNAVGKKQGESERVKKFHEKLKSGGNPNMRFDDLLDANSKNTGVIPEDEKDPTKWGDWQHGGRVSDF